MPTNHGDGGSGCAMTATGTSVELGTALGMVTCNNAFTVRVGNNGAGYIHTQTLTGCTPVTVTPCAGDEGGTTRAIWPLTLTSETTLRATFCVTAFGIPVNCTLEGMPINQNAAHVATITTGVSHRFCDGSGTNSVQGTWTSTDGSIEIID